MRILILAGFFPPHAPLAATRAPAFARWLRAMGHEVRVLAARNAEWPATAQHGLPEAWVNFTDIDPGALSWRPWRLLGALAFPDKRAGWLPHALKAGGQLIRQWRPDVLYATAPPFTTLLAAALLSRRHGVPWVAEFRDLWVDHPYYDAGWPRRALDRVAERLILAGAAGAVTVTAGWARLLERRLKVPVRLALNGFDPDDFPPSPLAAGEGDTLSLLYCGTLYEGKRDPAPLLAAMASLGERGRSIRARFLVDDQDMVRRRAAELGVSAQVEVEGLVPRHQALALQRTADLLVLLRWDDPREDSVIPGKFFEYVGAGRPLLAIGRPSGEVAEFIRRDQLGLAANEPEIIARHLAAAMETKRALGAVPPLPAGVRERYGRGAQFAVIEDLLREVARRRRAPSGGPLGATLGKPADSGT